MEWAASVSTGVTGYKVVWGIASGTYANTFDAGNALTARLLNQFDVGTTYYFAVKAYSPSGESVPSPEVAYTPLVAGMHRLKMEAPTGPKK